MKGIAQDSVKARQNARDIEPAAIAAWPARETRDCLGWLMRFSSGFTHRGNSVATLSFECAALDEALAIVERDYRERGLPAMFQIADAAEPDGLADELDRRGYGVITPTFVLATTADQMARNLPPAGEVELSRVPNPGFENLVRRGSRSAEDGNERLEILARIKQPCVCVTAFVGGHAIACGTATSVDGLVNINLMRTDADFRRQGHARRVLSAIAKWASDQNARQVFLGVEQANAPALALYAHAGFEPAYSYRYYRKTVD
jgi:GNAT superfamily N-acetyltransferase